MGGWFPSWWTAWTVTKDGVIHSSYFSPFLVILSLAGTEVYLFKHCQRSNRLITENSITSWLICFSGHFNNVTCL